jgi:hypothetical protein
MMAQEVGDTTKLKMSLSPRNDLLELSNMLAITNALMQVGTFI